MASLGEMRSLVNEQRSIKNQLEAELSQLASGIYSASSSWDNLTNRINNTLSTGASRVNNSHEKAIRAYEIQVEIEKMYALFKNIEMANKKIRECRNKIYYDFANYNAVRKIVQAMLNNIEVAFIHDSTIYKAVEVKHLQLPDYWLTCALLAIMAWRNNDKDMADRALARAYKLDRKSTSMFFFAFYIRLGRSDVSLKWFAEYVNCDKDGEDNQSLLLMFAIAGRTIKEECSDELVSTMDNFIKQTLDENLNAEGYSSEDAIERVRNYLSAFRSNDTVNYPVLYKYCTEQEFLTDEMNSARTNEKVLDFIRKTVNVTNQEKNDFLNKYIDGLIVKANSAEKETVQEIKYNELVIENQGHVDEAKDEYEKWKIHNKTELSIINEMIEWIYNSDLKDSDPVVIMSMFCLTKAFTEAAIQRNVELYRNSYKTSLNVKVNDYESVVNLVQPNSEDNKIDRFYSEKAANLIAAIAKWPPFVAFGVAALAVVGGIFLSPVLLVVTAGGAITGALMILSSNRRKKTISKDCEIEANNVKEIIAQVTNDFIKYNTEFTEYDNYYNQIVDELSKL